MASHAGVFRGGREAKFSQDVRCTGYIPLKAQTDLRYSTSARIYEAYLFILFGTTEYAISKSLVPRVLSLPPSRF